MKASGLKHLAEARGKENGYSAAADSFCAGCLAAGRAAAARSAAFLRRKYASRRLRLIRTWCCCPMESLWIENPRNAISIETDCVIFRSASCLAKGQKTKVSGLNLTSQSGIRGS